MKSPASPGERLFAAYLRQRKFRSEFEPEVEGRHPDFLIDHPLGVVVCDIAEPVLRLPSPRGGAFSSYPALRQVFTNKRKRKQAQAAAKVGLPFMHVLARTNSDLAINPLLLAGAMLGNVGFTFPVYVGDGPPDPDFRPGEHAQQIFGEGRRVGNINTSVSATAIVRSFNPTLWKWEQRARVECGRAMTRSQRESWEWAMARQRLLNDMHAAGTIDVDARLARVVVVHNPWAANPINPEAFGGPHDTQWSMIDEATGAFGVSSEGRSSYEIQGVLDST